MKNKKIDAYLITNKSNIAYLSNFTGSNGFMLICKKNKYLFTDSRYILRAKNNLKTDTTLIDITKLWKDKEKIQEKFTQLIKKHKITVLGIEENDLTVSRLKNFKKIFPKGTKYTDSNNHIENLRLQKTKEEIKLIKKSQALNEKIFLEIKNYIQKNKDKKIITEKELMFEILKLSFLLGIEKQAFEPIIAFGKNTASPHHSPSNTKLKKKDIVLIDMGMTYQGYHSDMTRTLFISPPKSFEGEIYNTVLSAQEKAIQEIKAGKEIKTLSIKAREIFKEKNIEEHFTHSLGHGVGLDIHELPNVHKENKEKLKENSIITIEPGIYLENKFGIRIEDMILVTKNGHQNLTKIDKKIDNQII